MKRSLILQLVSRSRGARHARSIVFALGCVALGAAACAPVPGSRRAAANAEWERGQASYYGAALHGNTTASGERFDMHAYTAAHKTLPFGTIVRVARVDDGRYVVVKINDRGPFVRGRIIDLSQAAAESIGMLREGVVEVVVEVIGAE